MENRGWEIQTRLFPAEMHQGMACAASLCPPLLTPQTTSGIFILPVLPAARLRAVFASSLAVPRAATSSASHRAPTHSPGIHPAAPRPAGDGPRGASGNRGMARAVSSPAGPLLLSGDAEGNVGSQKMEKSLLAEFPI